MSQPTMLDEINDYDLSIAKGPQVKAIIRSYFWLWYEANSNQKFKLSLFGGLLRPSFTIKDLKPVFILIFGA